MRITYIAEHAGQTFQRTSETKVYTHVVIARTSYQAMLQRAAPDADAVARVAHNKAQGVYDRFAPTRWFTQPGQAETFADTLRGRGYYDEVLILPVTVKGASK